MCTKFYLKCIEFSNRIFKQTVVRYFVYSFMALPKFLNLRFLDFGEQSVQESEFMHR